MILDGDENILEVTEFKLLSQSIHKTILSRFRVNVVQTSDSISMYYVNPETKERYIEEEHIVDLYLNREYRNLKELLKDHYVVRKYTKFLNNPFKRNKTFHFIIENYSLYYDFYLVCESIPRPGSCHYSSYQLYINDNEILQLSNNNF